MNRGESMMDHKNTCKIFPVEAIPESNVALKTSKTSATIDHFGAFLIFKINPTNGIQRIAPKNAIGPEITKASTKKLSAPKRSPDSISKPLRS